MCTSDYNQIEFSTSRPPSCHFPSSFPSRPASVVCSDITRHQSFPSTRNDLFRIFGRFWFHMGGFWRNNCFCVDTNHLQVISLDGTLNPLISLEAWVLKISLFHRLRFYIAFSSLMFLSPPSHLHPTPLLRRHCWRKSVRISGWFIKI